MNACARDVSGGDVNGNRSCLGWAKNNCFFFIRKRQHMNNTTGWLLSGGNRNKYTQFSPPGRKPFPYAMGELCYIPVERLFPDRKKGLSAAAAGLVVAWRGGNE
jgi:hypothetical protein